MLVDTQFEYFDTLFNSKAVQSLPGQLATNINEITLWPRTFNLSNYRASLIPSQMRYNP